MFCGPICSPSFQKYDFLFLELYMAIHSSGSSFKIQDSLVSEKTAYWKVPSITRKCDKGSFFQEKKWRKIELPKYLEILNTLKVFLY